MQKRANERPTLTILEGACELANIDRQQMEAALQRRLGSYSRGAHHMGWDNGEAHSDWIAVRREIVRIEKAIEAGDVNSHPNVMSYPHWEALDEIMRTQELPKAGWYDSIIRTSFEQWAETNGLMKIDDPVVANSGLPTEVTTGTGATKERNNNLALIGALKMIVLGEDPMPPEVDTQAKLIDFMAARWNGFQPFSKATLEARFAEANRIWKERLD